jgi:glycosyltransferase involved in cell wall biosynthesis
MKGVTKHILHIVGGMDRGGAETWLMHVLRNIDRGKYHFDFLVSRPEPCAYDDEIRSLGSQIIVCPQPQKPIQYARRFMRLVKENGPYDVIHSHVHHYSGFILLLAKLLGIKGRIAHSHSDTRVVETRTGFARKAYLRIMENMLQRFAIHGFACSENAAVDLYGGNDWKQDARWTCLYCGIDFKPFRIKSDGAAIRKELNLSEDEVVIGHVGRFSEVKNHIFLINIFAAFCKKMPHAKLLLVGDGKLRKNIEKQVHELHLSDKVIFAGVRPDVPELMKELMDVFLFPSLYEGLPLVLIEAQAAGLPCMLSDTFTQEVDIMHERIRRLPLTASPETWSDAVSDLLEEHPKQKLSDEDFNRLKKFDIEESIEGLLMVYGEC